jgi:hypothetical protein
MEKIPTMFVRDWHGDRSRVLNKVTPGCEWVLDGKGVATRKYDGTACMLQDGVLYKRHAVRAPAGTSIETHDGEPIGSFFADGVFPERFIPLAVEGEADAQKVIGWVPVGDGPEDKWHREALSSYSEFPDGTCELVGPKINGNPEGYNQHLLIWHANALRVDAPRDFAGLAAWFEGRDIEGVVWHHPDGRMAKIKARDFGLRRQPLAVA